VVLELLLEHASRRCDLGSLEERDEHVGQFRLDNPTVSVILSWLSGYGRASTQESSSWYRALVSILDSVASWSAWDSLGGTDLRASVIIRMLPVIVSLSS
jgi:hypothetical protein